MRIVLAVDGSPYSEEAVRSVVDRPWPKDTTVRVVSAIRMMPVLPPVGDFVGVSGVADMPGSIQFKEETQRLVDGIAERLRSAGLNAESSVREGDPRSVIVEEAKEWPADLIVVGSQGHTGIARWLLGSVAQSVVAHAPCSVEVVRRRSPAGHNV
jgi:nucleotide-binding universal stress UspA family protein